MTIGRTKQCSLKWGDVPIPQVDSYKYLGITFHKTGSWNTHLSKVVATAKKRLKKFSNFFNNYRLNMRLKKQIYEENIRSQMEYGSAVSWGSINTSELDSIQHKALLAMTLIHHAWQTGIENETGTCSLSLRREKTQLKLLHKILNMEQRRIPYILLHRNWPSRTSCHSTIEQIQGGTCRKWDIESNPHDFGLSTEDDEKNPDTDRDKTSKAHWNTHLNEKITTTNTRRTVRRTNPNHVYYGITPSLKCKPYLHNFTIAEQMRLRLVTDEIRENSACPICRDHTSYNTSHYVLNCGAFANERGHLCHTLHSNFGIHSRNLKDIIYKPPSPAVKSLVDEFLVAIESEERKIILDRNLDFYNNPADAIGKVIDITLNDNKTYRTIVTDYDNDTNLHTINPSDYDTWPDQQMKINLATFGIPEHTVIVPDFFALKFNPITSDDNINKHYISAGLHVKVADTALLRTDLYRQHINGCPHNGRVARRYISANRRESNALRYGVT